MMKLSISKIRFFSRLTTRERRIVVAGLAAAAVFCLLYFVLLPAYDVVRWYPDEIADRSKLLLKYRERIAQLQTRQQSLETSQKHLTDLESHLLNARTAASAQAQLQGMINDLAKQSQLQLNRSDFLPVKELSKDYEKVSIRIDALGSINQIMGFVMAAKSLPSFMLTDELRIWNYSPMTDSFKKTKQITITLILSAVIRHE